jgi:hypothetical protein
MGLKKFSYLDMNRFGIDEPSGIRGLLILVFIGLILNGVLGIYYAFNIIFLLNFFASAFIYVLLCFFLGIAAMSGVCIFLMFKKKKLFPTLIVITAWVSFAINLGFFMYFDSYPISLLISAISYIVLTLYIFFSKRVKNTFTE